MASCRAPPPPPAEIGRGRWTASHATDSIATARTAHSTAGRRARPHLRLGRGHATRRADLRVHERVLRRELRRAPRSARPPPAPSRARLCARSAPGAIESPAFAGQRRVTQRDLEVSLVGIAAQLRGTALGAGLQNDVHCAPLEAPRGRATLGASNFRGRGDAVRTRAGRAPRHSSAYSQGVRQGRQGRTAFCSLWRFDAPWKEERVLRLYGPNGFGTGLA